MHPKLNAFYGGEIYSIDDNPAYAIKPNDFTSSPSCMAIYSIVVFVIGIIIIGKPKLKRFIALCIQKLFASRAERWESLRLLLSVFGTLEMVRVYIVTITGQF